MTCKECGCELPKTKTKTKKAMYCDDCRKERSRESQRQYQRKFRALFYKSNKSKTGTGYDKAKHDKWLIDNDYEIGARDSGYF